MHIPSTRSTAMTTTTHRIVVLGAGYTGMLAAIRLARRTRKLDVAITLVNPSARFTERLRMHQIAAGQELAHHDIPEILDGTGIDFVQGRVTAIDPAAQRSSRSTAPGRTRLRRTGLRPRQHRRDDSRARRRRARHDPRRPAPSPRIRRRAGHSRGRGRFRRRLRWRSTPASKPPPRSRKATPVCASR